MEQEDYSKIYEYESIGKVYAGERACISLTSWKERINTVAKTLYSLIKMCPGFHIVLVLSKDEFPLKEKELPDNLMLFVNNKLIELFWIKPNLKSFKKVLFTADKYRDIPIISADDDFIYIDNFALKLYNCWLKNKNKIYAMNTAKVKNTIIAAGGGGVIYPPYCYKNYGINLLSKTILSSNHDDMYFALLSQLLNITICKINAKFIRENEYIDLSCSKSGLGYKRQYNDNIILKMFNELKKNIK